MVTVYNTDHLTCTLIIIMVLRSVVVVLMVLQTASLSYAVSVVGWMLRRGREL